MQRKELERYKERLEEMQAHLRRSVEHSISTLIEDIRSPGEHEPPPAEGMDMETALECTEANLLSEVNAALDRIDRATFGKCVECGGPISDERLEAIPYTAHCVACERKREAAR